MKYVINRATPVPPPVESVTLTVSRDELTLLYRGMGEAEYEGMRRRGFDRDAIRAVYLALREVYEASL